MRNTKRSATTFRTALIMSAAILTSGCDAVLDCVDKDGPVFNTTELQPATLNQVYRQNINVEVNNEPLDDRFDYAFRLMSGTFPPGISTTASGRDLTLNGTATELGSYSFEIKVIVDDGLTPTQSNLCYRTRTRNFTIDVIQDES